MTELESMLVDSAERIFSNEVTLGHVEAMEQGNWEAGLWEVLEGSGLTRVLASESNGGAGASWSEALGVLLSAGKHLVPVPFVETCVAGGLLDRLGVDIPGGPISLAMPCGHKSVESSRQGVRFTGTVMAPWGRVLTHAVVCVQHDGRLSWLLLPVDKAEVRQETNLAGQPRDLLMLDRVYALAVRAGAIENPKLLGALQQSIQIAGVLERVLNQSVQYATDRVQFGRPIGKFQVIQHQLAVMANHVASARMAVATACASMGQSDWERQAAIAKVICGQAAGAGAAIAHQVHGAMGFTYENSLHFGTRRLWSWRAEYGSDDEWASYLGRKAIARGGNSLWEDITAESPQA